MVCEVYLDARNENVLLPAQQGAAKAAEILIRGLARVGIVALVDEATGYQEVRARQELQKILEAYVQAEFRPWVRKFPDEFFRQIYRLQGWEFRPGTSKRTPQVGKLIKHYVYEQLPDGVLEELERVNPPNDKGHRPRKHHQHLTETTGNTHLDRQISTVTTLMRIARDRQEFEDLFERAFPPPQTKLPLVIEVSEEVG
ncbi:MAG: P63C domain-containing protein [Pseudonocardiaceae bacterium]